MTSAQAAQSNGLHDLVVGLVGAVGTDLPAVENETVAHLASLGYDVETVSLSVLLRDEYGGELWQRDVAPYDDYVSGYITAGVY